MSDLITHPKGEQQNGALMPISGPVALDTFGGRIHVEWNPEAAVTPLGQLPFFIDYLKLGGLLEPWVESCPLQWTSPNAPLKRDVLGTVLLSILSGHQRYAPISRCRSDGVNPALLGMEKGVSEDSVRRALLKMDEEAGVCWLQDHLHHIYAPLLNVPWILDADVTIKPLYGHQEGADIGYNPHKPGRPSPTYHSYRLSPLRLILEVEVKSGKKSASKYSAPGLWEWLHRVPREHWPALIRGDKDWGSEHTMQRAEQEGLAYLFKLRLTKNVRRTIERLMQDREWVDAGEDWQGAETTRRLEGWGKARRVVVLRRSIKKDIAIADERNPDQLRLSFAQLSDDITLYEDAVLVTSLPDEIRTIAQHYRDRADCENNFDELKNHWGWGGFTTQDLKRCRLMARTTALIYNGWRLFVRLARPHQHPEAITSRPLRLQAVGKQTQHANQTKLTLTSAHAEAEQIETEYRFIAAFFHSLRCTAEQLLPIQRWCRILSQALIKYFHGRQLKPPAWLLAPG